MGLLAGVRDRSSWFTVASRRRLAWYGLAVLVHVLVAPFLIHDWDGFVFQRAAADLLAGVTPYHVAEVAPHHIFLDDHWPPVNSWYAYPPLALLLFTPFYALGVVASADPMVHRVALKVPFIAGNLALAYVTGRLAHHLADGTPEARARRRDFAEKLVLFNPFLVFVAAAWGMFDAIMMAALLASVLLLERGRPALGGVAFAVAALTKIFPLFVSPLLAWYAWQRHSWNASVRYVTAAVAAFTAVCLPFFLASPWGFLNQTLLMHGARAPQGFALVSAPLEVAGLNEWFGWTLPVPPVSAVNAASTVLLVLLVLLINAASMGVREPRALLHHVLVVLAGLLVVSKVVNEQYLVMPIAILSVLVAITTGAAAARYRRAWHAFTWGGLVSSALLGFHFITFVPADVAARFHLPRPDDLVDAVATATDLPLLVVFSLPHLVAVLAVVPALVVTLRLVLPVLADGLRAGRQVCERALSPTLSLGASRRAATVLAVALLVGAPAASALLAVPPTPADPPALPEGPLVAYRYDPAIRNPSYAPEVRDGYWAPPGYPVPEDGYYTTNVEKIRLDMHAIRDLGADLVVFPLDAGNRVRLTTAVEAAASAGLRAAPSVDVAALKECPVAQTHPPSALPAPGGELPRTATTEALVTGCVTRAVHEFADHPFTYRVDDRPVLFVTNATHADWVGPVVRDAAPDAFLVAGFPVADAAPAWADAAYPQPPQAGSPAEALDAFEAALVDGRFRVAPVFPATLAVPPEVDGTSTFARTWNAAVDHDPDVIVLPWNLYRAGMHVEPASNGDWTLEARAASASLRNGS